MGTNRTKSHIHEIPVMAPPPEVPMSLNSKDRYARELPKTPLKVRSVNRSRVSEGSVMGKETKLQALTFNMCYIDTEPPLPP